MLTSAGRKRNRNGSVSRRVARGLVTANLSFSASSGLDRFSGGSDPSASLSSPIGRRCWSTSVATMSSETLLRMEWLTTVAISAQVRRPSMASSTR